MRILITRPEEDGSRLAQQLAALGHEPALLPLLVIGFPQLPPLPLSGCQALIATSRNALRGLAKNAAFEAAKKLPIYCVGEATSAFAAELGFSIIRVGAGTGKDLAPLIARTARAEAGPLLYLTGEAIAFDLAGALAALRFDVRRVIVYAAQENADAGPGLAALLGSGLDAVVLMSPRTAAIFAALLRSAGRGDIRGLTCYCYSQGVAKPLEQTEGLRISVAARPMETDLLALIANAGVAERAKSDPSDELLGKS